RLPATPVVATRRIGRAAGIDRPPGRRYHGRTRNLFVRVGAGFGPSPRALSAEAGLKRMRAIAGVALWLGLAAGGAGQPVPGRFASLLRQDESPPKARKNEPDKPEAGKEAAKGKGDGDKKDKNGGEEKTDENEKNGDKDKKDEKAGDLWPDWLSA